MTSTWPDTGSGEILGGRYQLGEIIGSGGMATVRRAHDLVLDRDVAVKVFRTDMSEAHDSRRVQAEVRMLGSVNHPNLVTLHDASLSDDLETAYLVMELVEGEDLGQLLAERRVSPRDAIRIGAQIASALAHIHRKGIVHRDVKPANILVRRDQDGRVWAKLADLGIARIADATHLTAAGTMLGTVSYLSPEQVAGGYVDGASDVYALGLVLIECLTGQRAFPGTPQESAAMRTVRPPELPHNLPEISSAVLRAMTAIDPAARLSAAQAEESLSRWEAMSGIGTSGIPLVSGPVPGFTGPVAATPYDGITQPLAAPAAATPYPGIPQPVGTAPTGTEPTMHLPTGLASTGAVEHTAPLPSGPVATGPATTGSLAATPMTTGSTRVVRRQDRRARVIAIIMWLLVVALLVAAVFLTPLVLDALAPGEASGTPSYPPVPGELDGVLRQLQEAVR
ncbi:serine/threonine-protein kinase [Naasia sp. SYSU D00057]|uniref:serine/threonine-protein kinase n=1 Tax=Naasia sp. SYSU D00057 TaxID=2817380 RepID=UPI001B3074FD|nr:serine/threonine-protein kinase [Naasia sp. SYSU D00057]